jgi:tyrosyl-tRNA synthetase
MKLKAELAACIVHDFHGAAAARAAEENFARVHQRGEDPADMPEFRLGNGTAAATLADLIVLAGLAPSKTEARRLLRAGAISVDGNKIIDIAAPVPAGLREFVLRCGKLRFVRVRVP